jgi:hypothetical protein
MSNYATTRTKTRTTLRLTAVGLVVVTAAIVGTLVYQPASSQSLWRDFFRGSLGDVKAEVKNRVEHRGAPGHPPGDPDGPPRREDGAVTEGDGVLPKGVTVFDDEYAGVGNLDPELLQALREAATDAADGGIEFFVTSGWRSPAYQNQLLHEAVVEYGSEAEAARWVATAETSAHVSGDAVDIGATDATVWLSVHGADYGLCQIYGNEPWHFELLPQAMDDGCPPLYADPTQDPRMQQ